MGKMKITRSYDFDMTLRYGGHHLHVRGDIDPGCPGTGPTYSCGGTPPEPAQIVDYEIFVIFGKRERLIDDKDGELGIKLEDDIFQALRDADDESQYNHAEAMMDERKLNIPEDQFDR